MEPMKTAQKLTTNRDIRAAHNWLFFTLTKKGAVNCSSMIEIVFYGIHHGGQLKDNPNGKKALARYPSPYLYANGNYMQPLPPFLDPQKLSVQIYFFMDKEHFIEIKDFDFTQKFNGDFVVKKSEQEGDNLNYINISSLFSIAASSAEPVAVNDPSEYKTVQKGKSAYKVFDLGGGQFKILRADTSANINPESPTGRGILKLYRELPVEG